MPNRRLYTGTQVQSLAAGWLNDDGTATLYLSSAPADNAGSLLLSNHTTGPVAIAAGSPAAYGSAPGGTGTLYLYFNGLLTNEQVQAVSVDAPGWESAVFTDAVTGLAYLAMAPSQAVTIPVNGSLSLPLSGVTATGSPRVGNLTLAMAGLTGAPAYSSVRSIFVNVAATPQGGNRRLELLTEFVGQDFVFNDGSANELLLVLTNPAAQPVVPEGASAWGGETPTFTFSFVFADEGQSEAGALTDLGRASGLSVTLTGDYGNAWQPVAKVTDGTTPVWVAQPDPNGGGTVLGTGANASVSFRISGLSTTQPKGATYLYVSYANVPGYDDGYFAVEIVKVPPVSVYLDASPSSFANVASAQQTQLTWRVWNATYATVTNTSFAQAVPLEEGSGTINVTVAATTVFTLIASNHYTGQTVATSATVTVTPDQFGLLPIGTIVMWSGSADSPPPGWRLCDGSHGTPNLVTRFILGAGTNSSDTHVGTQGGSVYHEHTGSANVTVASAGSHNHAMPDAWYGNTASSGNRVTIVDRHATSVTDSRTQSAGNHTHAASASVTVDSAYSMPPWYALAFIIKYM